MFARSYSRYGTRLFVESNKRETTNVANIVGFVNMVPWFLARKPHQDIWRKRLHVRKQEILKIS